MIILELITENKIKKIAFKIGGIVFITIISLNLGFVQSAINNFLGRWNVSPPTEFFINTLSTVLDNQSSIFGNGIGVTLSAARRFGNVRLIEIFPAQLIYEMGFIGLISFYTFATILVIFGYKAYKKVKDKAIKKSCSMFMDFCCFY